MSLDNTPKIDFTTSDGVTDDNLNDIGKNLNSLESSKYESGDSPTFVETTSTTTVTNGSTTLNGAFLPATTPVSTYWSLTTSFQLIARGVFMVAWGTSASPAVQVQIQDGTGWETFAQSETAGGSAYGSAGCTIFSDGTNMRIRCLSSTRNQYYLKF